MTDFEVGQRVRVSDLFSIYHGDEGDVVEGNYPSHVAVALYGDTLSKRYFRASSLTSIEPAPTSPAKPECYVTAWFSDDDDEHIGLTGDGLFPSKEDADAHARDLIGKHPSGAVAVLKMVSKHSSAVTVTSEDL